MLYSPLLNIERDGEYGISIGKENAFCIQS